MRQKADNTDHHHGSGHMNTGNIPWNKIEECFEFCRPFNGVGRHETAWADNNDYHHSSGHSNTGNVP